MMLSAVDDYPINIIRGHIPKTISQQTTKISTRVAGILSMASLLPFAGIDKVNEHRLTDVNTLLD